LPVVWCSVPACRKRNESDNRAQQLKEEFEACRRDHAVRQLLLPLVVVVMVLLSYCWLGTCC